MMSMDVLISSDMLYARLLGLCQRLAVGMFMSIRRASTRSVGYVHTASIVT